MARTKPKKEKPVESTTEFVARINKGSDNKRNGLKKQLKGARR